MITRNLLTLVAFGGIVALVACSTDDEPDKFASSDSFCSQKADAECKNLSGPANCASGDACKAARISACTTLANAAAAQGRAYRPNAAQACIDKVEEVYKEKVITAEGELAVTKICERVYGGAKKDKETCANTFECEASLICAGVCRAEKAVALGEGCGNAGETCATGTYCQQRGGNKFCVARNALDASCNKVEAPCVEDLRCVTRCVAKVTVGNPCDADEDCANDAPYCEPNGKKCRPKYQAGTTACKAYGSNL